MITRIRVICALAILVSVSVGCSTSPPAGPGSDIAAPPTPAATPTRLSPMTESLPYLNPDLPLDERVEDRRYRLVLVKDGASADGSLPSEIAMPSTLDSIDFHVEATGIFSCASIPRFHSNTTAPSFTITTR